MSSDPWPSAISASDYRWLDLSEFMPDEVSGTGWDALLRQLLQDIDQVIAGTSTKLRLLQAKEKLGFLHFYRRVDDATPQLVERIDAAVSRARNASHRTCFRCGQPATMRNVGGWIVPLCDQHLEAETQARL